MIATLGEAHDLGWRIRVYCRFGKREAMKSIRACTAYVEVDLATLLWTRGRDFPIAPTRQPDEMPSLRQPAGHGHV